MRSQDLERFRLRDSRGLRLVFDLVMVAPLRSAAIVLLLLAAGLAEGLGITAFLPVLSLAGAGTDDSATTRAILDVLEAVHVPPDLAVLLPLVALVFVAKAGLLLAANLTMGYGGTSFTTLQRQELLRHLLAASWPYLLSKPVGAIANVITTDAARGTVVYTSCFQIVAQAIQILVYFGIAFLVSPLATLFAAIGGFLVVASMYQLVLLTRRAGHDQQRSFQTLLSRLVDQLGGIKPIKAMGTEVLVAPFFDAETRRLDKTLRRSVTTRAAMTTLQEPLMVLLMCAGIYGAVAVLHLDFGVIVVLALVFYRAAGRLNTLQSHYQNLVGAEPFVVSTMAHLTDAAAHREHTGGTKAPVLRDAIALDRVHFAYGEKKVLDGVSMRVAAGRITALIGPSGSGKTSLVDLVIGLMPPAAGRVTVDGTPLDEINIAEWRRMTGYVPQELSLFNDSVFANITLGDPSVDRERVTAALRVAEALDFVQELPHGLDTTVGERGAQLSGGQRQRIALARALVRRPALLVLDEPTTALDPVSEQAFCATLRRLSGQLTVLVISHQPAIMGVADHIYLISDGRVEQQEPDSRGARRERTAR